MIHVDSFKPWQDRFLIRPKERKKETETGIVIADTVVIEGEEGIVEAVGESITDIKPGITVLYPTGAGWELQVKGVKMRVIRREQIEGEVV